MAFRIFFGLVNLGFWLWLLSAIARCAGETGEMLETCAADGGFTSMALVLFLWAVADISIYVIHRTFRRKPKQAAQ